MANGLLTHGDITVDFGALPITSQHALAQYGLSHYLGNVQASKLVSQVRGKNGLNDPKGDVESFRKSNPDVVSAWKKQNFDQALSDLMEGTVGTHARVGGPRKDPVEVKFNQLVINDILARLGARPHLVKAFKAAGKKDGEQTIDFGGGVTRTREQMIASTVAASGDKLRKEAEKMVRDEQRLAANAAKQAAETEGQGPEAMGF